MKKAVKVISLLLSVLVVASGMAGCTSKSGDGNAPASSTAPTQTAPTQATTGKDQKPAQLSLFFDTPKTNLDRNNCTMIREIEKRTNTKLTVSEAPSGQGKEKLNMLIAAGEAPDLIRVDTNYTLINMHGIQGAIQSYDELMDQYMPNMKKALNKDALMKLKASDNKLYLAPIIRDTGYSNFFIRQDWLDNLSMKAPSTLDEYSDVLKAFTEEDPDENGKKDTIGTSMIENLQWYELISGPFGLPFADWIPADDGSLIFSSVHPKMKEALAFGVKLYKDGVMDREFATLKRAQFDESLYNSKYGLILSSSSAAVKAQQNIQKTVPDAKLVAFAPPTASGTEKGISGVSSIMEDTNGKSFTGYISISKTSKQIEKAAEFVDAFYTEEMGMLQTFGIEGVHYTKEGDAPKYKPEYYGNGSDKSEARVKEGLWDAFNVAGIIDQKKYGWSQVFPEDTIKYMTASTENTLPKLVFFATPTGDSSGPEIDKTQKEFFTKILMGGISLDDGWNQWLKEFDRLSGSKWTQEVNEIYKSRK